MKLVQLKQLRNSQAYEVVETDEEREGRQRQLDEAGAQSFRLTPGQRRVLERARAADRPRNNG